MGCRWHIPLFPTILTSLSECHIFFLVLTSPDVFHHPSHHHWHTQSEETQHKIDGDDLKLATFQFRAPYLPLRIGSPLPLSSQLSLRLLEPHPSSFPVPQAALIVPMSTLDARPLHTVILSAQVPLPYTILTLTTAPLLQPETAMMLTGGEYPLPPACLHVFSPLSLTP